MSEIKVNKISPKTACGTTTLGDSGDTFTIPAGVTITNAGTQTGFGKTGAVDFVTTAKTGDFTAVAGEGYFVNTAGGAVTVTLPGSPSAGNMIVVSDYNSKAATNNITINRNGNKINGATENVIISKSNSAIQLVYVDATTGWQSVATANNSDVAATRLSATGGTVTESGNYKIHTFTGPGTFTVQTLSEVSSENTVDYLVVAGGGGGGAGCGAGGGGGAGGFRFFANPSTNPQSGPGSPRNAPAGIEVTEQAYPITVGAGGGGGHSPNSPSGNGDNGSNSSFSTITSHGGGFGAGGNMGSPNNAGPGGSGGGPARNRGGTANGNTPPVSPPQGSAGGDGSNGLAGDGGGGAMGIGGDNGPLPAPSSGYGGVGGAGAGITGFGASNGECSSCVQYFSGGGGGGTFNCATDTPAGPTPSAKGGIGGGGPGAMAPDHPGSYNNPAGPTNKQFGAIGTANTGGGGGGGGESPTTNNPPSNDGEGGAGGSGIVVIRYKFQ